MANVNVPPFTEAPSTVVGSTPQSVFPFDFPFWESADILVYVEGELLAPADYSVVGARLQDGQPVEGGYGSGTVTLDTEVSNCTVTIDRMVVGDRETQFSRTSPLSMPALNGDLNRLTARQQDLDRRQAKTEAVIDDAVGEFTEAALQVVNDAGDAQALAIGTAGAAEVVAIGTAGDSELSQIASAGDSELLAIGAAGDVEILAVASAATGAIADVENAAAALFYADTAAGLAAVGEGGFFKVVVDGRIVTYQDVAGVAVERASQPKTADIEALETDVASEALRTSEVRTNTALRVSGAVDDVGGKLAFGVDIYSGGLVGGGVDLLLDRVRAGVTFDAPEPAAHPVCARNMVSALGQSLANGYASRPILSTAQPYNNVMFDGGVLRPLGAGALDAYLPLISADDLTHGETIIPGLTSAVCARAGGDYPMLGMAWGADGTQLLNLSKPSVNYTAWLAAVTAGKALSDAAYESFAYQASFFMQGESDTDSNVPGATYVSRLTTYIADLTSDAKATTGQTHDPKFFFDQVSSWTHYGKTDPIIALAQLEVYEADTVNRILIGAKYHLNYAVDGVHLTNHSERRWGEKYGSIYHRVVVLGQAWQPLRPLTVEQETARSIIATFHVPSGPMVLDTTLVTDPGDYGFQVFDSAGEKTITSVTLLGQDKVRIAVSTDLGTSPELHYACAGLAGDESGPITGPRGCLRDSDPTPSLYLDEDGRPYAHFNWCVHFQKAIT